MLDTYQEYQETSIGVQPNSLRKTSSMVSLPKAARSEWELIHISRAHDKLTPNKDSPGPIYEVPSTVGKARVSKFGTGPQRYVCKSNLSESSTDLLGIVPDNQKFLYPGLRSVNFGTDSRDVIKNATILKNHPQAFFGTHSPGPAMYTLPDLMGKNKVSIASRTKQLGAVSQTPNTVGPGSYDTCTSFSQGCLFPIAKQRPDNDVPNGRCSGLYNTKPPGSIGPQTNSLKRSAPRAVLGSQTRSQWRKVALVGMERPLKLRLPHPVLPPRMETIKHSS